MLMRSVFAPNSKRSSRIVERSNSVRSALSMKASASASLVNLGSFFFIVVGGMVRVRVDHQLPLEETFDVANGKAMFLALLAIALVPIKFEPPSTYICQSRGT